MGGGKGGGWGGQTTMNVTYHYYCDVAVGLCAGPIQAVPRVFADGTAFDPAHVGETRVHAGDEAQMPDPLIQAVEGAYSTPAYRGLVYVVSVAKTVKILFWALNSTQSFL